mmetsp:Transcript_35803/g.45562  ORF Transcript_35803/g.45562 Transcript_35803/m.45562 type:complete len:422 (+) Transcript_35803:2-1267(+)
MNPKKTESKDKAQDLSSITKKRGRKCLNETCNRQPMYNYENQKPPKYCGAHKLEGMINIHDKKCKHEGCKKIPSYNVVGEVSPAYCAEHRSPNMVRAKGKCRYKGCYGRRWFNYPNHPPMFCLEHKTDKMVKIFRNPCSHPNCYKQPRYNKEGEIAPKLCGEHKLPGMVNLKGKKKCEKDGCYISPHFNLPGKKMGRYCNKHKEVGMINVLKELCNHPQCTLSPGFNYMGEKKRKFCFQHKLDGMVNVSYRKCNKPDCPKNGYYWDQGNSNDLFCLEHKSHTMVHKNRSKCGAEGCAKYGDPKFCADHRKKSVGAVCRYNECTKKAYYKYKGQWKHQYCAEHKAPGMQRKGDASDLQKPQRCDVEEQNGRSDPCQTDLVVLQRTCEYISCDKIFEFTASQDTKVPKFCLEHDEKVNGVIFI